MKRLWVAALLILLLAACGGSDKKDKDSQDKQSESTPVMGPMNQVTVDQLAGEWMRPDGLIYRFQPDGVITYARLNGSSEGNANETSTYTIRNSAAGPILTLNTSGSSTELKLVDVRGCNGSPFNIVTQGTGEDVSYGGLVQVGSSDFKRLTADEISQNWKVMGIAAFDITFADKGELSGYAGSGSWSLDGNRLELKTEANTTTYEIVRVARCQGIPLSIVLYDPNTTNILNFLDPSVATDQNWVSD